MSETSRTRRTPLNSKAFTLIEMLVVMLIIAILAVLGLGRYFRSSENGKADEATSQLNMFSMANRNYSLDHQIPGCQSNCRQWASGLISNACSGQICKGDGSPCDVVACNYLMNQDWSKSNYTFAVVAPQIVAGSCTSPAVGTYCPDIASSVPSGCYVACAERKVCGVNGVTTNCVPSSAVSANWGYVVDTSGVITPIGGAPAH